MNERPTPGLKPGCRIARRADAPSPWASGPERESNPPAGGHPHARERERPRDGWEGSAAHFTRACGTCDAQAMSYSPQLIGAKLSRNRGLFGRMSPRRVPFRTQNIQQQKQLSTSQGADSNLYVALGFRAQRPASRAIPDRCGESGGIRTLASSTKSRVLTPRTRSIRDVRDSNPRLSDLRSPCPAS